MSIQLQRGETYSLTTGAVTRRTAVKPAPARTCTYREVHDRTMAYLLSRNDMRGLHMAVRSVR